MGTVDYVNNEDQFYSVKPCVWVCPCARLACSKRRLRPRLLAPCACAAPATSTTSMIAQRCILLLQSSVWSGLVREHWSSCAQESVPQPWSGMMDVRAWRINLGQLKFQTSKPTWDNHQFKFLHLSQPPPTVRQYELEHHLPHAGATQQPSLQ